MHVPYCRLWPAQLYYIFPSYLIKGTIFEEQKKKLLNTKMCVLIFFANFVWNIVILRTTERDVTKNVYWSGCRVPAIRSNFNSTWIFSTDYRKILEYKISRKSVQRQPFCSTRTDRRTDMTKLIVAFRDFANAPKNTADEYRVYRPVVRFQLWVLSSP